MKPLRVQRSRRKGAKLPANTVCVTRPGKWGNPFRGGWFMVGDPDPRARFRMSWCQARDAEVAGRTPGRFTLIESPAEAVEMFRRLCATGYFSPEKLAELRGKNLACYCAPGAPCHADVLLEIANQEDSAHGG